MTGQTPPTNLVTAVTYVLRSIDGPVSGVSVANQLTSVVGALLVDPADPLAYNPAVIVYALENTGTQDSVPEPAPISLLGAALVGLVLARDRRVLFEP